MTEHSIPFELLIKKRDNERRCPSCELEQEQNILLLFFCTLFRTLAKSIKAIFCFVGIFLKAVISTCFGIVKLILCLAALLILLVVF